MQKRDDIPPDGERPEEAEGAREASAARLGSTPAAEDDVRVERDRLDAQLKRTMADLANIRKRQARELEEARRRAVEGLATELLPVLDNFELALAAHRQHEQSAAPAGAAEAGAMIEGLHMVRSLLAGALERHGLAEIPAAGEPFDPNVHDAVSVANNATIKPGYIAHVVQTGYRLGERVIRPTKVVVAAEPNEESSEDDRSDPRADL